MLSLWAGFKKGEGIADLVHRCLLALGEPLTLSAPFFWLMLGSGHPNELRHRFRDGRQTYFPSGDSVSCDTDFMGEFGLRQLHSLPDRL